MKLKSKLREMPWVYSPLVLACVRCLLPAIRDAFWQFYRSLAASLWFYLYSTESRRKGSRLYAWLSAVRNGPPFKMFSIYQALRCGWPRIPGRIVLEDQGWPVVRPGSLLAEGHTEQHTDQPWPVFWSRHSAAHLVSPSLALVTPEKELAVESVYGHRFFSRDPAVRYFKLPPPVTLAGNWTSLVSRWVPTGGGGVPNHSHWLLDALPRLALLGEFPADTRAIVPGKLAAYQRESLAMLGLNADRIRLSPETHLRVENYYFSSLPSMVVCYSPYAVRFLREKFLPQADVNYHGPKKFFITRRNAARNAGNNAELEEFFLQLGWGVVDLCELTFAQEIKLFSEAEAVCGVGGSGLTNVIFSKPNCAVMLVGHDYWTDGTLDWIVQTVGIEKYGVQICPADACRRWRADLGELKRQLQAVGAL